MAVNDLETLVNIDVVGVTENLEHADQILMPWKCIQ